MTSSTYSVAEAESWGTLADGFHRDMRNILKDINGSLTATVPYFQRPGEENIWAGAGGVLTSARDLVRGVSRPFVCPTLNAIVASQRGCPCS